METAKEMQVRRIYFEDGVLCTEILYDADDKSSGVMRKYYPKTGELFSVTPYKNGKRNGVERDYSEEGVLIGETPYKNDKIEGTVRDYDLNGKLFGEFVYEGDRQASMRLYHESGALRYYADHICEREYSESGALLREVLL